MPQHDDQRPRPPLLEMILYLAANLIALWAVLPPEDRRWLIARITHHSRRALATLAAREGHAGMGDELAGRPPAGRYNAAYWLARGRDWLTEVTRP